MHILSTKNWSLQQQLPYDLKSMFLKHGPPFETLQDLYRHNLCIFCYQLLDLLLFIGNYLFQTDQEVAFYVFHWTNQHWNCLWIYTVGKQIDPLIYLANSIFNCVADTLGEQYTAMIVTPGSIINLITVISIPLVLWQYGWPG